jgi:hypothetical protein
MSLPPAALLAVPLAGLAAAAWYATQYGLGTSRLRQSPDESSLGDQCADGGASKAGATPHASDPARSSGRAMRISRYGATATRTAKPAR